MKLNDMRVNCLVWALLLVRVATIAQADSTNVLVNAHDLSLLAGKTVKLFKMMGKPQAGDWLESHPEEGQTFSQYVHSSPTKPTVARRTLYISLLGDFTDKQSEIVKLTAQFMGEYFGLPVKIGEALPLSLVPENARRAHPSWHVKQVLSTYVLDDILTPRLPPDAAASLAFTTADLWPGEGWNFVFGQASLQDRVGVWSLFRNGNLEGTKGEYRFFLLRTLKIATHETGHMFGMEHCIQFECGMSGCNSQDEADRRPIEVCPECVAKLWWATGVNPECRYRRLGEFCSRNGLKNEAGLYEKLGKALMAGTPAP